MALLLWLVSGLHAYDDDIMILMQVLRELGWLLPVVRQALPSRLHSAVMPLVLQCR
jgi:hypothetical protein